MGAEAVRQGLYFTGEVTLGTLIQVGTMVAVAVGLYYKITGKLDAHADAINRHADTLNSHEDDIRDLIRQVSLLVGWQQGTQGGRRQYPRSVNDTDTQS